MAIQPQQPLVLNPWTQGQLSSIPNQPLQLNDPGQAMQPIPSNIPPPQLQQPAPQAPPEAAVAPTLSAPAVVAPISPDAGTDLNARSITQQGDILQQKSDIDAADDEKKAALSAAGVKDEATRLAEDKADHMQRQQRLNDIADHRALGLQKTWGETVDPNRLWNHMSTGGKILSGISILLGGAAQGAGAAGGHATNNAGMDKIQSAITQDIDAQKENINNHYKNLVQQGALENDEQTRSDHEDKWRDTYNTNAWATVQKQIAQVGMDSASPVTKLAAHQSALMVQDKLNQLGEDKYNRMAAAQAAARATADKLRKESETAITTQRDALLKQHEHDEKPYTEADLDHDLSNTLPQYYNGYGMRVETAARRALLASGIKNPTQEQIDGAKTHIAALIPAPDATRAVSGLPQQNPGVAVEQAKVEVSAEERSRLVDELGTYVGRQVPDWLSKQLLAKGIVAPETTGTVSSWLGGHGALTAEDVSTLKSVVTGKGPEKPKAPVVQESYKGLPDFSKPPVKK